MRISVNLPDELRADMERISKESGDRSLGSIIREALLAFIEVKTK
jgi:metal-responsive CopG/Arc/MetJ family transcriptional regulator